MKNKKGEQLYADTFLKEHFERIKTWAVGDIRKCCRLKKNGVCQKNGAFIGTSILWICAIEFFGGLLTSCSGQRETNRRIESFVKEYLSKYGKYNPQKLNDLRWSLVHFYSVRHFTIDESKEGRKHHLKKIENRDCLLHLGRMIEDLEKAVSDYTKDLWKDPRLRIKAFRYFRKTKIIMPISFEKMKFLDEDCD